MIAVLLMGGLGNQMFQYAAALRLARRHSTAVLLDLSFLRDEHPRPHITPRSFALEVFGIDGPVATAPQVRRMRARLDRQPRSLFERARDAIAPFHAYSERQAQFDPAVLDLPDRTYLQGYFQDACYFADIAAHVRTAFQPRPPGDEPARQELAAAIGREPDAVCLHVRRGDYVSNPVAAGHHGTCSPEYYEQALAELSRRGRRGPVYVFSDDPGWCRRQFAHWPGVRIVSREGATASAGADLWLMTQFRTFVLSNSSFAWWAAWLSVASDKLVVRPARWFNAPELSTTDICPPEWLKIHA